MHTHLLYTILDQLQISHTKNFVSEIIKGTPFANSMYGIGLMLTRFNVPTESVRFSDISEFGQEYAPCVVLYNGEFVIVTNVTSQSIVLKQENGKLIKLERQTFEKKWDGNALLIIRSKLYREPNYNAHQKVEIKNRIVAAGIITLIITLLAICVAINPYKSQFGWWSLVAINILGLLISILLLQKDLNIHNSLTEKICGLTKNGNCSEVTNSSGSTLFGILKLSEVGFSFFVVNLIYVIISQQSMAPLAIIAYLVLPFSFWSIWYQKFKAKSWCVLCLGVLAVLWTQAAIYYVSGVFEEYDFSALSAIFLVLSYGLAFFATDTLMNILYKQVKSKYLNTENINTKYNPQVMNSLLPKDRILNVDADSCSELVFGNPDAPIEITVFSNPYCSPCAEMHKRLSDISGDIAKVRYVMTFFAQNLSVVNRKIIAAYQQLGAEVTWELLTKWYATGKQQGVEFFDQLELDSESESVLQEFNKHQNWAKQNPIGGTPTVLINGVELIPPYRVEDYKIVYDVL